MAERQRHPWLKRAAVGVTAVTLLTACSSGGSDDDSRGSTTSLTPTTQPGEGLFSSAEGKCLLRAWGPESPSALKEKGISRVAVGVEYYRYTQDKAGVWGTEKLSDPWMVDCVLTDGSRATLLLAITPLSKDGKFVTHKGSAVVEFGPDGAAISYREPQGTKGAIRYRKESAFTSGGSLDKNWPLEIEGDESVPDSLSYVITLDDGTKRKVMTREFFPGQIPEQVMPQSS